MYEHLAKTDPEIYNTIRLEIHRQRTKLELIASENFTSLAVMEAMGSVMTNKYAEGYPGKRYYGGCEFVDMAEDLARNRLKELFGCDHANVQPHSGSQANMAVYFTVLKPGDTVLGLNLSHGGHLTHGHPINFSGTLYNIIPYSVEPDTEVLNYDRIMELALEHRPKMIIAGASAYARTLDFAAFRRIADAVEAVLMVDIAHIAGLVAAGLHPSPVPLADFVTSTTHKTLRGPRGGIVMCKEKWAKELDTKVMPGIQGGPLMHVIAAKAVAFLEASKPEFKTYQQQVLKNAQALAFGLKERGLRIVTGGTDTHLMLVNLVDLNLTGKEVEKALDRSGITANKNTVPFDPQKPFVASGIRLGTPAVTTRGMREKEMDRVAELIVKVIRNLKDEEVLMQVRDDVEKLCSGFPLYPEMG